MNPEVFLNDLARRGVYLEARGAQLHVEAPSGVLSDEDRGMLKRWKHDLLALLSPGVPPAAALDHADTLRDMWRQACRELGEACGWPELPFRSGRAVAPGAALWGRFLIRASVPDLQCVLVALRERVGRMPPPPLPMDDYGEDRDCPEV